MSAVKQSHDSGPVSNRLTSQTLLAERDHQKKLMTPLMGPTGLLAEKVQNTVDYMVFNHVQLLDVACVTACFVPLWLSKCKK